MNFITFRWLSWFYLWIFYNGFRVFSQKNFSFKITLLLIVLLDIGIPMNLIPTFTILSLRTINITIRTFLLDNPSTLHKSRIQRRYQYILLIFLTIFLISLIFDIFFLFYFFFTLFLFGLIILGNRLFILLLFDVFIYYWLVYSLIFSTRYYLLDIFTVILILLLFLFFLLQTLILLSISFMLIYKFPNLYPKPNRDTFPSINIVLSQL